MSKQINLVINGKGGVGKSFFASNFVQYLRDCGIAHWAIDSDHENAILKRFIAVATPRCRKDIDPLSRDAVIVRCLPSAAPFIPTTRDHCGVLRIPHELATLRVNRFPILLARCAL
jgi:CO dehydrogenase nickel-insertion accessory protein CooC1